MKQRRKNAEERRMRGTVKGVEKSGEFEVFYESDSQLCDKN
jgi:hypothetical protein